MLNVDADARLAIRLAFLRDPDAVWTLEGLASSFAIPVSSVSAALDELVAAGALRRLDDEYVSPFTDR